MTYQAGVLDISHVQTVTTSMMIGSKLRFGISAGIASQAWPVANDAYAVPFLLSTPTTFVKIFFQAGTSPGTAAYDLGVYRDDFTLVGSIGATASVNTTDAVFSSTLSLSLVRGRYFIAMSSAATTLTVRGTVPANQVQRAFGMFKMASAHPLPTTFVPASMGTSTLIPTLGLATASNAVL